MSAINTFRKRRYWLSSNAIRAVILILVLSCCNYASAARSYVVYDLDGIRNSSTESAKFRDDINEIWDAPVGLKVLAGEAFAEAQQQHLRAMVDLSFIHGADDGVHSDDHLAMARWVYDDLIFSGPTDPGNDTIRLRYSMELDGTQDIEIFFGDIRNGSARSRIEVGSKFSYTDSGRTITTLDGFRSVTVGTDVSLGVERFGVLSEFEATGEPERITFIGPDVRIGVPITLDLSLLALTSIEAYSGSVILITSDFENTFRFPTTGPVFDLPEGYTVNSEQAGIVNNRFVAAVPVPTAFDGRLETFPGSGVYQAYYDSQLDITWAADANINGLDTWDNQEAWAADLTIGGVSGWRLPSANVNGDGTVVDCSGGGITGCEDNEMGFLYWVKGITAATPSPFNNVQFQYWSGTELASDPSFAWFFNFGNGGQNVTGKSGNAISAWAVHDGDVGDILETDEDGDGLVDIADNCILIPNGPLDPDAGGNSQLDADGDGYGNICDPDFDNNNRVDFADLAFLKSRFFTDDPDADLDGDGKVDFADLAIQKSMFFLPPGPSGLVP